MRALRAAKDLRASGSKHSRSLRRNLLILTGAVLLVGSTWINPSAWAVSTASSSALPVSLGMRQLAVAVGLVSVLGGVGLMARGMPSLAQALGIACARCAIQLYLAGGFLLTHILTAAQTRPAVVWGWIGFTSVLAANEAAARVEYTYPNLRRHLTIAVVLGASLILSLSTAFQVFGKLQPWYSPRTWIPVAGMLLGNAVTATGLAAASITREFAVRKDQVELLLARGATWQEATASVVSASFTAALTPTLNALSVTGIIHIPGMMTGQILAGQIPYQAALYQIIIFFLITATSCSTVPLFISLVVGDLVDQSSNRLCTQDLTPLKTLSNKKRLLTCETISSIRTSIASFFRFSIGPNKEYEPLVTQVQSLRRYISVPSTGSTPKLRVESMFVPRINLELSFDLTDGDHLAIEGRSGAGKSQVLRTIAGLEKLNRNELKIDGISAAAMDMSDWRRRVALVPQDRPSLDGTPRQFYERVAEFHSQKVASGVVGSIMFDDPESIAAHWDLPKSTFDQPWSSLSGGEAQRASIAIALSFRPEILLLDESMSALDAKSTLLVEETLARSGIPIVLVSHSQEQVNRFCNRTIKLSTDNQKFRENAAVSG